MRNKHLLFAAVASALVIAPTAHAQLITGGGSGSGGGSGTVTSVGLALPSSILTVSGSPVTTTGTLTGTLATQSANSIWAGPTTGAAATPTFRALVAADLPAGTGTVTSITGGTGILPSTNPCIATCTLNTTVTTNAQTGTSYAIATTDGGKFVTGANAGAQAYTLPVASTTGYTAGYGLDLYNKGAGALTLTATTSTFGNALTTLVLATGQDAYIASDGTNYETILSLPVMAADTMLGNFSATANYPIAGALSSCSSASNALTYNTSTHAFGCNTISGGGSGTVNSGTAGNVAYYATSTNAVSDGGSAAITVGILNITSGSFSPAGAGFNLVATGSPAIYSVGTRMQEWQGGSYIQNDVPMLAAGNNSYQFNSASASATVPTYFPNRSDTNAGIGADTAGDVSIIADASGAATELIRVTGTSTALNAATITFPNITGDTGITDSTVCRASTGGRLYFGSGTLGICLGTSSIRYKRDVVSIVDGLPQIEGLRPVNFYYKDKSRGDPKKLQYGFIAEEAVNVLPKLVGKDIKGRINTFDYMGLIPVLVKAMQQQQAEIVALQKQIAARHR